MAGKLWHMKTIKKAHDRELVAELTKRYAENKMSDEFIVAVITPLGQQTGVFMAVESMRELLHKHNQSPKGYYYCEVKGTNATKI